MDLGGSRDRIDLLEGMEDGLSRCLMGGGLGFKAILLLPSLLSQNFRLLLHPSILLHKALLSGALLG